MPTMKVTIETDVGTERELTLPARYEVCDRCEGEGTHLHPDIGEHAYSQKEFNEAFDDDESREAYFKRGGVYDVICVECKGKRVVPVLDREELQDRPHWRRTSKRYTTGRSRARILKRIDDRDDRRAEQDAIEASERRYFAMFEG